jgi:hypothetical protein
LERPEICTTCEPQLVDYDNNGHAYACHFADGG